MIRVAHLSDTHLGHADFRRYTDWDPYAPGRRASVLELDLRRSFAAAIDEILRLRVDLVVHTGDFFDSAHPSFRTIDWAQEQLKRLDEVGIPILIVAGNHCCPAVRDEGHVLSLLRHQPGVRVVLADAETVHFPELDLQVVAVPHWAVQEAAIPPLAKPRRVNIAALHGAVAGDALYRTPWEAQERTFSIDSGAAAYDYVALGHCHAFGRVSAHEGVLACYAGSPNRVNVKMERADPPKGLILVEIDETAAPGTGRATARQIVLPSRPLIEFDVIDGSAADAETVLDRVRSTAEGRNLDGAIVRVRIDRLEDHAYLAMSADRIAGTLPASIVWAEWYPLGRDAPVDSSPPAVRSIPASLARIVEGLDASPEDKAWLLRHGQRYLEQEKTDESQLVEAD